MKFRNNINGLIIGLFISLFSLVSYSKSIENIQNITNFEKTCIFNYSYAYVLSENLFFKTKLFKKAFIKKSNVLAIRFTTIVKKDSVKPGENVKETNTAEVKKPFFGKFFTYGLPPAKGAGPCKVGVFQTTYFFGLKISGPKPVMKPYEKNEDILTQEVVECGEEYVPKKEKEKLLKKEKKENAKVNNRNDRKQDDFLDGF